MGPTSAKTAPTAHLESTLAGSRTGARGRSKSVSWLKSKGDKNVGIIYEEDRLRRRPRPRIWQAISRSLASSRRPSYFRRARRARRRRCRTLKSDGAQAVYAAEVPVLRRATFTVPAPGAQAWNAPTSVGRRRVSSQLTSASLHRLHSSRTATKRRLHCMVPSHSVPGLAAACVKCRDHAHQRRDPGATWSQAFDAPRRS